MRLLPGLCYVMLPSGGYTMYARRTWLGQHVLGCVASGCATCPPGHGSPANQSCCSFALRTLPAFARRRKFSKGFRIRRRMAVKLSLRTHRTAGDATVVYYGHSGEESIVVAARLSRLGQNQADSSAHAVQSTGRNPLDRKWHSDACMFLRMLLHTFFKTNGRTRRADRLVRGCC